MPAAAAVVKAGCCGGGGGAVGCRGGQMWKVDLLAGKAPETGPTSGVGAVADAVVDG